MPTLNTAVIYFSRLPGEETHFKTFVSQNTRLNNLVSAKLYEHTKTELIKTGLPVYYYSEAKQKGKSFGEKISNACKDIFGAGHDSVIITGSDTLGLDARKILNTATHLQNHSYVAGPTQLGGCYLFGINAHAFCEQKITQLQWQTTHLQESIKAVFADILFLDIMQEINSEKHLKLFLKGRHKHSISILTFINLIKSWFLNLYFVFLEASIFSKYFLSTSFGRAP